MMRAANVNQNSEAAGLKTDAKGAVDVRGPAELTDGSVGSYKPYLLWHVFQLQIYRQKWYSDIIVVRDLTEMSEVFIFSMKKSATNIEITRICNFHLFLSLC